MATEEKLTEKFKDLEAEKLLQLVRVAEMSERYDDMCFFVKLLVQKKTAAGFVC